MKTQDRFYTVTPIRPTLGFPLDMLRYDGSTFADETSAGVAERLISDTVRASAEGCAIKLVRYGAWSGWSPNDARWRSFGWRALP